MKLSDPPLGGSTYQAVVHPQIHFATYHPFFRQRQTHPPTQRISD